MSEGVVLVHNRVSLPSALCVSRVVTTDLLLMPPFPRLYGARGPGDLPTSWWLEQVVVVDFLEWEG
jgi:hypothetical protein